MEDGSGEFHLSIQERKCTDYYNDNRKC